MPCLRLHHSGNRAAAVLVQQSLRRLPDLRRSGFQQKIDAQLIVPEPHRTLRDGRSRPGPSPRRPITDRRWKRSASITVSSLDRNGRPAEEAQKAILFGTKEKIKFEYKDGSRAYTTEKTFEGVVTNLERRWKETDSAWAREEIERFMADSPCPACNGFRLKPEALAVKIGGCTSAKSRRCRSAMRATGRGSTVTSDGEAERDRGSYPEGDPRASALPERRGSRISQHVAQFRHAVGW